MNLGATQATRFVVAAILIAGVASAQCPTTAVTTYPWLETFDNFGAVNGGVVPPPDWAQDLADGTGAGADWVFRNGPTPSVDTGPPFDHTTGVAGQGFYVHVEDSGATQGMVNLISPCLDLSPLSFPRLQFWLHSNNATMPTSTNENFFEVDVIIYPGGVATTIPSIRPSIGHVGDAWVQFEADLTPFMGQTIQVVFRGSSASPSFTHDIAIDDVSVDDGPPFDVGVTSVAAPLEPQVCGMTLSNTEIVTVEVTNFGLAPLTPGQSIPLEYTLDGGAPVSGTLMIGTVVSPFQSVTFTFPGLADFSAPGNHVLVVSALAGDPFPANDTLTANIDAGTPPQISMFPYLETFDGFGAFNGSTMPPQCWNQDPLDGTGTGLDTDWIFASGGVAGGQPPADNTTGMGFFAYVEDASNHPFTNLETPEIDLSAVSNPGMRFWAYSNNTGSAGNDNTLHIDVLDVQTLAVTQDVIPPIASTGPMWVEHLVSLNAFANRVVRVIFRATTDGGGADHNIGIDDVEVFSRTPGPGQAGQPGRAEFDINDSMNAAGFRAQPGESGPFFANASVGGLFTVTYRGEPNQPFLLLAGDLTPAVISIPGIGNVDVGGPLNMAGNLTTLEILLSGLDPTGLNPFANTGPTGEAFFQFQTPNLALGILTSFQAAIYNSVSVISFSNAVEVTIVP